MKTKQATKNFEGRNKVYIWYRLNGSLFNLRRLQARTLTLDQLIRDLMLAHIEAVLPCISSCFIEFAYLFGQEVKEDEDTPPASSQ